MLVRSEKFGDETIEIHVHAQTGHFSVTLPDEDVHSFKTMKELDEYIKKARKRRSAKLQVEITAFTSRLTITSVRSERYEPDPGSYEDLVVVGVHSTQDRLLLRDPSGKAVETHSRWHEPITLRRLSDAEKLELAEMESQLLADADNLKEWLKERTVDVRTVLAKAKVSE